MAECKNCGKLATKVHNLINATIDCECGTYIEDNMTPDPVKTVIYDRSSLDYKVINREDVVWRQDYLPDIEL